MNLKNWSTNMAVDNANELDLSPQGVKDQIFLAQRMKEIFPKLLQSRTKDDFKVMLLLLMLYISSTYI